MNKTLKNIIQFIVFITIGIFIFWLVYRNINIKDIVVEIKKFNFLIISISLIFGILSHYVRAIRWKLIVEPLGYKPRTINSFFAVLIGYLANFAVPRMGEVTRCGVLSKYEKIPFSNAIGTVVVERILDLLMSLFIFFIALLLQFGEIKEFFIKHKILDNLSFNIYNIKFIVFVLIVILSTIILFSLRDRIKQNRIIQKIYNFIKGIIDGIKSIKNIERKWLFIFYTLLIWVLYILTFYVCFYAYEPTSNLSFLVVITVFSMANFGTIAPVQGGIGPWHFMVIQTLLIYSVSELNGQAFAFVVHTTQTVMLIILGFISLAMVPLFNKVK